MEYIALSFTRQQVDKLFPFYFILSRDLKVCGHGRNLQKLCHTKIGKCITDYFSFNILSNEEITFGEILSVVDKAVEVINNNNKSIRLYGSFEYLEPSDQLLFIGTPAIQPSAGSDSFAHNLSAKISHGKDIIGTSDKEIRNLPGDTKLPDHNSNGIVITDTLGNIEWINSSFEWATGYRLDEVIGKRPRHVLYGKDSTHVPVDYVDDMVKLRQPFTFENVGYSKSKQPFWFRATVHPIINDANEITGRFSVLEDITEVKRKEKDLAHSNEIWHLALEGAGHGVWSFDYKNREIQVSKQFRLLLGYADNEKFSTSDWEKAMHPDDMAHFLAHIFPFLSPQNPKFVHEHRLRSKDGQYRHFITRANIIDWGKNSEPLYSVGTLTDINDWRITELELRSTSERLSSLIQNLDCGVLLEDDDRKIAILNEQFCNIFNIPILPGAMKGMDCSQSLEQTKHLFKEPETIVSKTKQILKDRQKLIDDKIEMADGRILQRDYIPIFSGNEYLGHLWKYQDITERINYQNNLLQQREYYHNILDQIPADIVIFTTEHQYEFINKTAVKNDELRNWMLGRTDYDYCNRKQIPVSLADDRRKVFDTAINTKKPHKFVEESISPDGKQQFVVRVMHPYINEYQNIGFVVGYGVDVTEQIKNERYLEVQEQRIRNLLEIISDGVVRCEVDGNINVSNTSFFKIMEIDDQRNYDTQKLNFFDLLPATQRDVIKALTKMLIDDGSTQKGVFNYTGHTGTEKYINYYMTRTIRSEDAAFVVRISDITDIVNREKNLNEIIEKEKELNASKSRFIHITSHELRTPLAIIQANTEILEMIIANGMEATMNIDPAKMLERINKEVVIMTDILNQLMMISKIESGNVEVSMQENDIRQFINGIWDDLYNPYTDGRILSVEWLTTVSTLNFDKKLLRLAIVNIVNNAFKYSSGKLPPELRIMDDDNHIVFEIQDFGIGIPAVDQKKLFGSFFRASNVGAIQGTGLGLNVVDYAVKKNRGTATFSSEQNTGTTFTISIPKAK